MKQSFDTSVSSQQQKQGMNPAITINAHAGVQAQVQPIALSEMDSRPSTQVSNMAAGQPLIASLNPLHQVKTTLQVCVGHAIVTVGELMNARAEQVLRLDSKVQQPVDLLLEGQVVARGQLVAVGDHFGVRITELPIPLRIDTLGAP